jgi:predicted nucleic acid-binding protein
MPVDAFINTNIFVYSVSSHPSEKTKHAKAQALLGAVDFGTSPQVVGEFYVTTTQKIAEPLSEAQALQFIERLARLPIVPTDGDLVFETIALKQEHHISYWDAAIMQRYTGLAQKPFTLKISLTNISTGRSE